MSFRQSLHYAGDVQVPVPLWSSGIMRWLVCHSFKDKIARRIRTKRYKKESHMQPQLGGQCPRMFSCFLITGLKPFPEQRGTCSLICCIPAYFHLAFASLLLLRKALGCWQSSHPEPGPLVVVPSLTAMGSYGHGLLHAVNQCPQRLPRIPQQALK